MSALYTTVSTADILRFAAENPLAWIVPAADPDDAILMPLLMETGADGAPATLLGHLPRSGPLTVRLRENPRATCLFLGPHSYVSPRWISKPGWAPTWNFVSLKVTGTVTLDDTLTEHAVRTLATHMEAPAGSDWSIDQVGARLPGLLRGIIGFRMQIEMLQPRFKTGQDESAASQAEIHAHLDGHPLQSWMTKP
ncbi:MAG: FMN-binding negative transcriptional regulator [Alphaproteobacteria bacterium HGW-Alphaproteobacteria-18]|nr:MAG: FMN-binding negative transcriptional regulator [Alphaproteobacteria bacterium HGW-Alphaproteobacteria-18]